VACYIQVLSSPNRKYQTKVEVSNSHKYTSLECYSIIYDSKKFYGTSPCKAFDF
jgi:hypothetical protein